MNEKFSSLSPEFIVTTSLIGFVILAIVLFITIKFIKTKKPKHFRNDWRALQQKLPNKDEWGQAIKEADKLLDEALKKHKVKGSSTGERIMNAHKIFSDSDGVWFGHKLRKKFDENPKLKLEKSSVVKALVGLRQGIKDLGAFDGKK